MANDAHLALNAIIIRSQPARQARMVCTSNEAFQMQFWLVFGQLSSSQWTMEVGHPSPNVVTPLLGFIRNRDLVSWVVGVPADFIGELLT